MPRIRTIKPSFFTDSKIGSLKPLARIFFIGLWCHADKEGRLKDRPQELGVQIVPYDLRGEISGEVLVREIEAEDLIVRYEVKGKRLIQICHFLEHQRPHHTEAKSVLPGPDHGEATVKPPLPSRKKAQEGKGKERKGKENGLSSPPDGGFSARDLASLWNDTASTLLPRIHELSERRLSKIRRRLKEHPDPAFWRGVIKLINESAFCRGEKPGSTWKASFMWLMENDENAVKVSEGNYSDKKDAGFCRICRERPVRGPQSQLCVKCAHCSICGSNIGKVKLDKRTDGTYRVICAGGCRGPKTPAPGPCRKCAGEGRVVKAGQNIPCPNCGGSGRDKHGPVTAAAVLDDLKKGSNYDPKTKAAEAGEATKKDEDPQPRKPLNRVWP